MQKLFLTCSLGLMTAMLSGYASSGPTTAHSATGVLLDVKGDVSVAGSPTLQGATLLPGDVLHTGHDSAARLGLGPQSVTTILSDTQLSMLGGQPATQMQLRHGSILVQQGATTEMRVKVRDAWVVIRGVGASQALCEVANLGSYAQVSLHQGFAEIDAAFHAPVMLHPGELARLESDGIPDAGQQGGAGALGSVGTVTREMPRGTVDRQAQQNLPLKLNDPVEQNDLIHTVGPGRLQITLADGSVLSVGSRSELRVTQFDPNTQQSQFQLTAGKIRADVQKITKQGGKFEVRTKTAVIGVVGTSFVAETNNQGTRVCGVDGTTVVGSSDPTITATVTLHKGECTFVPFGGAPTTPAVDPSLMASLMNQTVIGGAGSSGAVLAGATSGTWVVVGAASVAGAVGIAVGAYAVAANSSKSTLSTP